MALMLYLKIDQSEDEKDQVFFKALKRGLEQNDVITPLTLSAVGRTDGRVRVRNLQKPIH